MDTYTVDASAVLVYLVDALPPAADDVFSRAEAGEAVLELPATAAVETLTGPRRASACAARPSRSTPATSGPASTPSSR